MSLRDAFFSIFVGISQIAIDAPDNNIKNNFNVRYIKKIVEEINKQEIMRIELELYQDQRILALTKKYNLEEH